MGILFGLAAALSFGTADYFAGKAGRKIGLISSLFAIQFIGLVLLTLTMTAMQLWPRLLSVQDVGSASLWMAIDLIGIFLLCQGLRVGHAAIVAPIASSFSAVTVVLAVIFGETLSLLPIIGIPMTICGVILTSLTLNWKQTATNAAKSRLRMAKGAVWAVLAALALGAAFFGLRFPSEALGGVTVVWIGRMQSSIVLFLFILLMRKRLHLPRFQLMPILLVPGILDGVALVCYNIGLTLENTSLVVTATSLFAVVTVLWGMIAGKERLVWNQWLGISLTLVGILLVSLR